MRLRNGFKFCMVLFVFVIVSCFTVSAHAVLIDNLDGTVTQNRVDGSSLMWLKDANLASTNTFGVSGINAGGAMFWNTATDTGGWIEAMNATNYLGYSDWRLPYTNPLNGVSHNDSFSFDGSTDFAYNISAPGTVYENSTASEMAYMYYVELGNLGSWDTSGNFRSGSSGVDWGLSNTGLFTNLQAGGYWSGTESATNIVSAWNFSFYEGGGWKGFKGQDLYAWAVRSNGFVEPPTEPIPEPATIALLGIGLAGLAGGAVRRKYKKTRREGKLK